MNTVQWFFVSILLAVSAFSVQRTWGWVAFGVFVILLFLWRGISSSYFGIFGPQRPYSLPVDDPLFWGLNAWLFGLAVLGAVAAHISFGEEVLAAMLSGWAVCWSLEFWTVREEEER